MKRLTIVRARDWMNRSMITPEAHRRRGAMIEPTRGHVTEQQRSPWGWSGRDGARVIPSWALGVLAAWCLGCGGTQSTTTAGGEASQDGPAVLAKKIAVSWGIQQHGEMADVFLATTDETGKQISHSVGTYKGACAVFTPAPAMNALTGVQCKAGDGGTELHAVTRGGEEIIVLQMGITANPDPMAREEVTTVKVPLGVKIEAGT
ncbi:MAG: hypothetical protein AB7P03_05975 [Kofleriaceae bacterium]